jgi:hypothetical protein
MAMTTTTDTTTLVLHDREPDCDGIGYSWRRVTVPKWLGDLVLKTQEEAREQGALQAEATADMLKQFRDEGFDKEQVEPLVEKVRRADIFSKRASTRANALHDALIEYLLSSEQGDASCSHVLSDEERQEFQDGLIEKARKGDLHPISYWHGEGYCHVFYSR